MDENPNTAGVCGEIAVEKPWKVACRFFSEKSIVVSAQIFEYKVPCRA
jgi:hypothetical protein